MLLCVFFCEIVVVIKTSDTRAAPFLIQRRKFYLLQNCKVNTKIYGTSDQQQEEEEEEERLDPLVGIC